MPGRRRRGGPTRSGCPSRRPSARWRWPAPSEPVTSRSVPRSAPATCCRTRRGRSSSPSTPFPMASSPRSWPRPSGSAHRGEGPRRHRPAPPRQATARGGRPCHRRPPRVGGPRAVHHPDPHGRHAQEGRCSPSQRPSTGPRSTAGPPCPAAPHASGWGRHSASSSRPAPPTGCPDRRSQHDRRGDHDARLPPWGPEGRLLDTGERLSAAPPVGWPAATDSSAADATPTLPTPRPRSGAARSRSFGGGRPGVGRRYGAPVRPGLAPARPVAALGVQAGLDWAQPA